MKSLQRIACGLAATLLCAAAAAQTGNYPTRPIKLITPFAAGGAIDVLCRVIGERLSQRLGQNILVESIPGANTIIGTQALLRAAPDGYTFMITTMSTTVNNRILYSKLSYDPEKDLAPITQLSYGTVLLVGPGNAPYKDLQGFIEWAKAQKRSISYGSWASLRGAISPGRFSSAKPASTSPTFLTRAMCSRSPTCATALLTSPLPARPAPNR